MLTVIFTSVVWTALCSWILWASLLAIGAFILGWLFRSPKIDEWRHKYETEVSNNTGFAKKYGKLEKTNASFMKEQSNYEKLIEKQKSEIVTLKNRSSKLENDYRSANSERDSLNKRLGLLNSEIAGLKGTGEVVETEGEDENEKEIDRLTSILHNRDNEIERLRNSVSEVKAEKDEYIRRSESYKPRFEEANLERNTLKVKYDKLVAATANISSSDVDLAAENGALKKELAGLRAQVSNAPTVDPDAQAKAATEMEELRKATSKAQSERDDLQIKYESLLRHNEELEASKKAAPVAQPIAAVVSPPAPEAPAAPVKKDDLTKIEGIGPKIAGLLNDAGINSFEELSKTDPAKIKEILNAAGPRYKMHDPTSWPIQAGMAYRGEWAELEKWQDEHDGGRMHSKTEDVADAVDTSKGDVNALVSDAKDASTSGIQNFASGVSTPPAAMADDDLTKIEGIGPKIQEIIKNGGIKSWVALSNTDPAVIKGLLTEAGSRFQMHDPSSWPLQAGMAARGEWEALEKWQDEHDGGKIA